MWSTQMWEPLICNRSISEVSGCNVSQGFQRLSCTWGADVGRNGHIWAQTQEVALVGLLILTTVWHRTHTANWEQGLMGERTEIQKWVAARREFYPAKYVEVNNSSPFQLHSMSSLVLGWFCNQDKVMERDNPNKPILLRQLQVHPVDLVFFTDS